MTAPLPPPRSLPLLPGHGGRSAMTCLYRCGNACAHPAPNTSGNEYFGEVAAAAVSRRGLLRVGSLGALVIGAGVTLGSGLGKGGAAEAVAPPVAPPAQPGPTGRGALTFRAVPPNTLDAVVVPNGYDHAVLMTWGDPVEPGAPAWSVDRQSAAAQARQFGFNNDWLATAPLGRGGRRALLVVNHEYTNEDLMFRGFTSVEALSVEQLRIAMAAHGLSVVEIERVGATGQWRPVRTGPRRHNRRITARTPMRLTGPAAGSSLLRTAADPRGVTVLGSLNNCAGGLTPWGTVLSGEENFNQYFVGGDGVPAAAKPALNRYGITTTARYPAGSRRWERADARFDLAVNPNEANRFGWIVEVDPYDARSTPRKHTALGRFKHEGAEIMLAPDGRIVAYMGDDERFDYLYKFVSDKRIRRGDSAADKAHNLTLLESGTLYVAKFDATSAGEIDGSGALPSDGAFDGGGRWIPLARGNRSLVAGMSVDAVLVHTRLAADAVGATKMDRPEDVQPNPRTGKVYVALTNNTRRGAAGQPGPDEPNPRSDNRHGHILEIVEAGGDSAAETFGWSVPIVCGDPADPSSYFAGFDKSQVSPISCPDNLEFDVHGNLWISTDGNALGANDGLFAVPVEGPGRGHVKQFLTVPRGAEQASAYLPPDNRTAFVSVQHPGEIDGATVDDPASTWPHGTFAQPAVVTVWRLDGGEIGR
ncbi:PhoX family phosphatase [Pilimelia columellifera]|uniref:PhoX family protein n=1 Tax=Pilimelia columellifera subsp. columellifera TaxID=706583 RepID=A0ABN3MZU1_9ACTN